MKKLLITALVIAGAIISPFVYLQSASAVTAADWKAGRIIDDFVFTDKFSMTASQIQQFLDGKVACDTWGTETSEFGGGTRAQYGASHGNPAPYTCLESYYENPSTKENNLGGKAIPAGGKSAAELIWQVAQEQNINPQVLIVLLQKEQGLVTDEWPFKVQYDRATGFGCPDTAPCNTEYYGFYNQIWLAARQFNLYAQNPNSFNHVPNQNNFVRWSPNSSCGGSTVFIENQATASLYNYTPYQPNQAALNNLYGSGDGCSAYGNRNFWRTFNDWFGSTRSPAFAWQRVALWIHDETKATQMTTDHLRKGERLLVSLKVKNVGTSTWYRDGANPLRLGTDWPKNRKSEYCDITWPALCHRAARLLEPSVAPGSEGHFEFYIHAPNQGGEFREWFEPLAEMQSWMSNDIGFHIYVNSTNTYDWQWRGYNVWTNNTKTTPVNPNTMARNQEVYVEVKIKNKSATIWRNTGANPVRVGTSAPQDRTSILCTNTWVKCNRPAAMLQEMVKPGQEATFGFTVKMPNNTGEHREYLRPLLESKGWGRDDHNHLYFKVTH